MLAFGPAPLDDMLTNLLPYLIPIITDIIMFKIQRTFELEHLT